MINENWLIIAIEWSMGSDVDRGMGANVEVDGISGIKVGGML